MFAHKGNENVTTDGDQHSTVHFYLHDVVDVSSGDDQLVFSQSGRQHCRQVTHTECVQEENLLSKCIVASGDGQFWIRSQQISTRRKKKEGCQNIDI